MVVFKLPNINLLTEDQSTGINLDDMSPSVLSTMNKEDRRKAPVDGFGLVTTEYKVIKSIFIMLLSVIAGFCSY